MREWWQDRGRTVSNFLLAILMIGLYISTATPVAQSAMSELYGGPVYRGHSKDSVALACAVSWDAKALPDMLTCLHNRGVVITFFVSGDWAQDNTELLQYMVSQGHEIGTLGQTPREDGNAEAVAEDISQSLSAIRAACGVRPMLYHSGSRSVGASARAARRLDMEHILCTVDLLSARGSSENILTRALESPFGGSIILMQPTAQAVKALPACLDGLSEGGYRVTTVTGVME